MIGMKLKFDRLKYNKGVIWFGISAGSMIKRRVREFTIQIDLFKWAFKISLIKGSK